MREREGGDEWAKEKKTREQWKRMSVRKWVLCKKIYIVRH